MDPYFDNSIVLLQFQRLFKLLNFEEDYKNHNVEVLVDNHGYILANHLALMILGEVLEQDVQCHPWNIHDELNNRKTFDCFFQSGPRKGQRKGLLNMALELGIKVSTNYKLEEPKFILSGHKVFQNVSCKRYISFNDCTAYFSSYGFLN